jgi:hypothetical protein
MISMEECRESAHMLATDRLVTYETKDAHRTSERPGRRLTKSMTNGVQAASQFYQGHAEYIVEDRDVTTADSRSIRELSTSIVKIGCPATGRIRSMLSAKTDSLSEVA